MTISSPLYIVGIDLGTTNSAVAWVDLMDEAAARLAPDQRVRLFEIPQITGKAEISSLPVLPSFLYIPGPYDHWCQTTRLPWDDSAQPALYPPVGAYARDYGAERPDCLVTSAKSWLCHGGVDRRAPILPWGASDDIQRVSPVAASTKYLRHLRAAWNSCWPDDEARFLEHQLVVLTVPASFDEVARDLTLEAAQGAGLPNVVLLEEPLAAFYSWLMQHEADWGQLIAPGDRVVVVDVGGGTTDLTLIALEESSGSPRFQRLAVGDHLILGGDNMDLALARYLAPQLQLTGGALTPALWKSLCHQCRQAKEVLLTTAAASRKITLMGRGRRLIADTRSVDLERSEVERLVLDGFFPLSPPPEEAPASRKGISELGLPYETQPAITWHLARFLHRHTSDPPSESVKPVIPEFILFNGGALKPQSIQQRIIESLRSWGQTQTNADGRAIPDGLDPEPDAAGSVVPRLLPNPRPELAVALGAAYYGLVKAGVGVRVGSGSPRAYYLEVARVDPKAPEKTAPEALCLVERGLDEGTPIVLPEAQFEVRTNQPVSFNLYSSSFRSGDRCGDRVWIDDSLTPLPPLQTVIQYGKKTVACRLPVTVEALYTELGTLGLWCRSLISDHRWRLQFNLREPATLSEVREGVVFEKQRVDEACEHLKDVFSTPERSRRLTQVVKSLSDLLEMPKAEWPLGLLRAMADTLLEQPARRLVSPEHASRWLNLVGFCLRPGFGDSFDSQRMPTLWKIFLQGPPFASHTQVRLEWWVLWRRIAGGLTAGQQRQFFQTASATLNLGKGRPGTPATPEQIEIWMALAAMERLPVKDKTLLGRALLERTQNFPGIPRHWWALGRLGARELLYGPQDRVLLPGEVTHWIDRLLRLNWLALNDAIWLAAGTAIMHLARKTGDQARDLPSDTIDHLLSWMSAHPILHAFRPPLTVVTPLAREEADQVFGEQLPAGLLLVSSNRS